MLIFCYGFATFHIDTADLDQCAGNVIIAGVHKAGANSGHQLIFHTSARLTAAKLCTVRRAVGSLCGCLLQLAVLFSAIYSVVGAPVAFQTFDPRQQPSQFLLSGAIGTGVVVLLAILRIYLGWAVRPLQPCRTFAGIAYPGLLCIATRLALCILPTLAGRFVLTEALFCNASRHMVGMSGR